MYFRSDENSALNRQILFLQFPSGRFGGQLAQKLRSSGHTVHKIAFCLGDCLALPGKKIRFVRPASEWPDYLRQFLTQRNIDTIVLFGDCRYYHSSAIKIAEALKVRVLVLEEGYLRPDWITAEEFGVNANSRFKKNYVLERLHPAPDFPENVESVAGGAVKRAFCEIAWGLTTWFGSFLFANYKSHRLDSLPVEAFNWTKYIVSKPFLAHMSDLPYRELMTHGKEYFFLPLQLSSDFQLRQHSPFKDMHEAAEQVIASFKKCVDSKVHLVVKTHPLDPNALSNSKKILSIAEKYGIRDRVIILFGGHLPSIIKGAKGIVTVNSTVGLQALLHGKPVKVLGKAIYDLAGLTCSYSLDHFWKNPAPPNQAEFTRFHATLIKRAQINGSFVTRRGKAIAIEALAAKVLEPAVVYEYQLSSSTLDQKVGSKVVA